MSVYRRGAVYWWCRSVTLGNDHLETIRLRVSLKTSDKSEAKRRAAMLEVELDMVAVRFPVSETKVLPGQLLVIYKQALEYKRDQIAVIQSRPPFNDAEHRRYNTAYSRIFGAIAHTGLAPNSAASIELALGDDTLGETERALIRQLAAHLAIARPHQRPFLGQCRPPAPLRSTCGQHWPRRSSCTNNQHGPLSGGRSLLICPLLGGPKGGRSHRSGRRTNVLVRQCFECVIEAIHRKSKRHGFSNLQLICSSSGVATSGQFSH